MPLGMVMGSSYTLSGVLPGCRELSPIGFSPGGGSVQTHTAIITPGTWAVDGNSAVCKNNLDLHQ